MKHFLTPALAALLLVCVLTLTACGGAIVSSNPPQRGTAAQSDTPAPETSAPPTQIPSPIPTPEPTQTPPPIQPAAPFSDGKVIEIKEKMFLTQTNEIYLNSEDYLGKTFKFEGLFDSVVDESTGDLYCFVIRNGPGCCPG
ncbi:MAG: hypothetical protein LBT36_06250, partial [Oscillospiraceae bacterium]|nr:hypothetical protein [Oscillospiraceae bacterium]